MRRPGRASPESDDQSRPKERQASVRPSATCSRCGRRLGRVAQHARPVERARVAIGAVVLPAGRCALRPCCCLEPSLRRGSRRRCDPVECLAPLDRLLWSGVLQGAPCSEGQVGAVKTDDSDLHVCSFKSLTATLEIPGVRPRLGGPRQARTSESFVDEQRQLVVGAQGRCGLGHTRSAGLADQSQGPRAT